MEVIEHASAMSYKRSFHILEVNSRFSSNRMCLSLSLCRT